MKMKSSLRRNLKYCTLQGIYWMLECIAVTFAGIFLLERGYSNTELGIIMAAGYILGLVLQPVFAGLADRSQKLSQLSVMYIVAAGCAVSYVGLLLFPARCLALTLFYVLQVALEIVLQPLVNAFAFTLERMGDSIAFGTARSFGSLFFAVCSAVVGVILRHVQSWILPILSLFVLFLFVGNLFLLGFEIRGLEKPSAAEQKKTTTIAMFVSRYHSFLFLLIGIAGIFFGHSMIDNFPYQIVVNVGGDSAGVGTLHAFIAMLEIPGMLIFDRLHKKFSCVTILKCAAVLFFLKNLATWLSADMSALYLTQILHALSFSFMIPAAVRYADETMDARDTSMAQALVTGMMYFGNVFSSAMGGLIIDRSSVSFLLLIGAVVTAVGSVCVVFGMRKKDNAVKADA